MSREMMKEDEAWNNPVKKAEREQEVDHVWVHQEISSKEKPISLGRFFRQTRLPPSRRKERPVTPAYKCSWNPEISASTAKRNSISRFVWLSAHFQLPTASSMTRRWTMMWKILNILGMGRQMLLLSPRGTLRPLRRARKKKALPGTLRLEVETGLP
mmetsp:Transcript_17862/g.45314  ORF Transcript_17862/g.45314 Transcript_17862/m.45314 type:complete len:157 (-) Transcript_17862:109-579(-)